MNVALEVLLQQGFLLDFFGILGLGLVSIAALRLARRLPGRSASLMAWGALALIAGRLGILFMVEVAASADGGTIDPSLLTLVRSACMVLLTAGLGAIVWGFWSHEKQLAGEESPA